MRHPAAIEHFRAKWFPVRVKKMRDCMTWSCNDLERMI
ncbi:hypothetical protein QOZ94_001091 [Xanthobacter agilis]|uniref:Transcriptional regulator n=1 Tax=Xanthobacter agilis TaxID=47492 RepID=A0ABU0LB45_XANAG|nr:hypothetical protein [Xanthobacter agilis]